MMHAAFSAEMVFRGNNKRHDQADHSFLLKRKLEAAERRSCFRRGRKRYDDPDELTSVDSVARQKHGTAPLIGSSRY